MSHQLPMAKKIRSGLPPRLLVPGWCVVLWGIPALLLLGYSPVTAQQLTLKREIPGGDASSCPPFPSPSEPTQEERTEARRLASDADQALILGEPGRARDLLARAIEMDPASPDLGYRYARTLEEMGADAQAVDEYCRVLALDSGGEELGDASARLRGILERERAQIPGEALMAFEEGIGEVDDGHFEEAFRSFESAWQEAPSWAAAVYNRGILGTRLGRVEGAAADFQRYLELRPDAEDAVAVSQVIGELRGLSDLPGPATALTLGLVFPGAGQFYSGRAWGGVTVLTMAAGAVAAGFLIEEVSVRCVGTVASGEDCPPDRIVGEESDTPYIVHGLAAAGAVALVGAVESFFRARGRRAGNVGALVDLTAGGRSLSGPSLSARGPRVELRVMQLNF